jgi:hypothetical protein
MKNRYAIFGQPYWGLMLLFITLIVSCHYNHAPLNKTESLLVNDSINRMMAKIAGDISENGPRAWLNYLKAPPTFLLLMMVNWFFRIIKQQRLSF